MINCLGKGVLTKCLNASTLESFTVTRPLSEFHFTLYYYDQAGNLIKTVSPSGVKPDHTAGYLSDVVAKRAAKLERTPLHTLNVLYRYNSLNQVVVQSSPDGGKSLFWYDRLGRLAISQNAKQKPVNKYSYTQYDDLGRITFVGEKPQPQPLPAATLRSPVLLKKWIDFRNDQTAYQPISVVMTVYDVTSPLVSTYAPVTPFRQKSRTLRNRVSYTRFFEIIGSTMAISAGDTTYNPNLALFLSGSEYSYDIHGNVDSLLNCYGKNTPFFQSALNKFKLIAYNYDLISGKVNTVHYNPGSVDEFYHRYSYDAENRLTDVYTTDTKVFTGQEGLEDHDAHYAFYRHGPMARQVIGQQQVQGIDYVYTLQGWIKGVNNTKLTETGDPGSDGRYTARDAYSYNLNYYANDYQAIGTVQPFADHVARLDTGHHPLYKGNINSMAVNIRQFNQPQLYNYRYDQLNRITKMDVYRSTDVSTTNTWNNATFTGEYMERVAYDPNGNILKYLRQGSGSNLRMDSLSYFYNAGTNQLNHIQDRVNGGLHNSNFSNDLDDQIIKNYEYDEIGNMIKDTTNRIKQVDWNVYGKITKITKVYPPSPTGTMRYTDYDYDPAGNRISKVSYPAIGEAPYVNVYVRDAQGNIMAEYEKREEIYIGDAILKRHHIYGSSRLGIINREVNTELPKITSTNMNLLGASYVWTFERGKKNYELANHLGNVLVTISDKKSGPLDLAGHEIPQRVEYSDPDVVTANDYYPFGMLMNGRNFNKAGAEDYKFGFNSQEKSDEISGPASHYTALYWEIDSRAGGRWNMDPKPTPFESPYVILGNNPIWKTDILGDSSVFDNKGNKLYYDKADKDLRVFMKEGNKLTQIGLLGRNIEVNKIFSNILKENKNEIKSGFFKMTPIGWYTRVKKDGKWDYKDNKNTIFGIAWEYDLSKNKQTGKESFTNFVYKSLGQDGIFNAADVGNYNAGYTGTHLGLYTIVQKIGAGYVEQNKQGKPFNPGLYTKPPYGDMQRDYYFNSQGMKDAQKELDNEPKPIFFK